MLHDVGTPGDLGVLVVELDDTDDADDWMADVERSDDPLDLAGAWEPEDEPAFPRHRVHLELVDAPAIPGERASVARRYPHRQRHPHA